MLSLVLDCVQVDATLLIELTAAELGKMELESAENLLSLLPPCLLRRGLLPCFEDDEFIVSGAVGMSNSEGKDESLCTRIMLLSTSDN